MTITHTNLTAHAYHEMCDRLDVLEALKAQLDALIGNGRDAGETEFADQLVDVAADTIDVEIRLINNDTDFQAAIECEAYGDAFADLATAA